MTFFLRSAVILTSLILFVLTMRHFEVIGSKEAGHIIKQYKQNAFTEFEGKLVQIENKKAVNTILIVDCGSDMCAGVRVSDGRMIYFNKKNQTKFASKKSFAQ